MRAFVLACLLGACARGGGVVDASAPDSVYTSRYLAFVWAAVARDRKAVAAAFSPAVIAAQGEARLVDEIDKLIPRFGPFALGISEAMMTVKRERGVVLDAVVDLGGASGHDATARVTFGEGIDRLELIDRADGRDEIELDVGATHIGGLVTSWTPKHDERTTLTMRNSISAPPDRFVVARRGKTTCAVRLSAVKNGAARYDALDLGDGTQAPRTAYHTRGEVEEVRSPTGKAGISSTAGTIEIVQCGRLEVLWSAPSYLYFSGTTNRGGEVEKLPAVDLAVTDAKTAAELDLKKVRVWQSHRWGELAWDPDAERRLQEQMP